MAMPNLAWGGFKNGQIPRGNLVDIGDGKLLQADAARNWTRFCAAFRVRWAANLYLDGYQDAYRDWDRQDQMYQRYLATGLPRNGVAKPGNSIHGWARSVDCTGYGTGSTTQRHVWMQQNGPSYGWSWSYGRELKEPWHWDYIGPITTTAGDGGLTPIQEEDHGMYLKQSSTGFYTLFTDNGMYVIGDQANADKVWRCLNGGQSIADINYLNGVLLGARWAWDAGTSSLQPNQPSILATAGSFTTADRAMLDDIATKGELSQALTSTVVLVNEHADENKDEVLEAIEEIPSGGASSAAYSLELNIDGVPGTATGTATPSV